MTPKPGSPEDAGKSSQGKTGKKPDSGIAAPRNVKAEAAGPRAIKVSWERVDGARGYAVLRGDARDGEFRLLRAGSAESYTDRTADAGRQYWYKVRALVTPQRYSESEATAATAE